MAGSGRFRLHAERRFGPCAVVCIFPEGRVTGNGELYPLRPGLQRILEETPVPVVPAQLLELRAGWR